MTRFLDWMNAGLLVGWLKKAWSSVCRRVHVHVSLARWLALLAAKSCARLYVGPLFRANPIYSESWARCMRDHVGLPATINRLEAGGTPQLTKCLRGWTGRGRSQNQCRSGSRICQGLEPHYITPPLRRRAKQIAPPRGDERYYVGSMLLWPGCWCPVDPGHGTYVEGKTHRETWGMLVVCPGAELNWPLFSAPTTPRVAAAACYCCCWGCCGCCIPDVAVVAGCMLVAPAPRCSCAQHHCGWWWRRRTIGW